MTLTTNPKHLGWDVGVEVICGSRVVPIEKVYKNGRVVVGGEQWSPSGDAAFRGGDGWRVRSIRLATPEARADLAKDLTLENARRAALRLSNRLYGARRARLLPHLPAIEALLAALEGREP